MYKPSIRYNPMKARAGWLKYSIKDDLSPSGKKRFLIHKNSNSNQFDSLLKETSSSVTHRESLPKLPNFSKKIFRNSPKNDLEVEIAKNQIHVLEARLKQKETQLNIMENMLSISSKPQQDPLAKKRTSSLVSLAVAPDLERKVSVFPSMDFKDFTKHPVFVQPKFTKSHPKLVLSNPITGVLPSYN